MKKQIISIAVASAMSLAVVAPASAAAAAKPATVSAAEFEALKAQLAALQSRLAQLETQQQAQAAAVTQATTAVESQKAVNTELQDSIDRTGDNLAKTAANVGEWVGRFQWKGDLRYRNETIDQEYISGTRNRDRIRLRAGFFAKVNDTVRVEVQMTTTEHTLTTTNGDPRSPNQTLTDANSRKALDLDTAYAEWQPNAMWKLTLGKMRYPWVRPGQSMLFDGDVNPEGLAVNFTGPTQSGVFASAWYTLLAERNAGAATLGQTSLADSNMLGAQVGWRSNPAQPTRFMIGASYFQYGAVKGYNPFYDGSSFGNSTTTSAAVCRKGIATCLANDFQVVELIGEAATVAGGYPLTAYFDYLQNTAATTPYDTAYSVGFQYGRASAPRSWELGAGYQKVEKDSQFGQYFDSDFGAGNTDSDGWFLKAGYQFAKNWKLNGTYFLNKTNNDVGTAITGVGTVVDRDYKRLQLDLSMNF